jgi:hypothetical protein
MDRLLEELTGRGVLDAVMVDWARAHHDEHGGALDSALLELDLVDEEALLAAMESCFGMAAARHSELERVDPDVGTRFPEKFSQSFLMCPLRCAGDEVVVLVESPLADEWLQELRDIFGVEAKQLLATAHCLAVARERVYGTPLDDRARALQARLVRRRGAVGIRPAVDRVALATTLSCAVEEVLDFAACLVEFSCFLVRRQDGTCAAIARGDDPSVSLPAPEAGCTLAAAIRFGGFFLGPLAGNDADRQFYEALGRPLPEWAFVAPVPAAAGGAVVFYADNGPRGIAKRWVAELSLLVARVGQQGGDWGARNVEAPVPVDASDADLPAAAPAEALALTSAERAALDRLRPLAAEAGLGMDVFVDSLLREYVSPRDAGASDALAGDVKGLFEKLATDIPAQLARGMEAAFRDLVPRLSAGAPPGVSAPAPRERPPAAAGVELVQKPSAPRETPSYRSRRRKSKRVKL